MIKRILSSIIILCFFLNSLGPIPKAQAGELTLPVPGTMVNLSPAFEPALIKGLTIHKDNPFLFDFIVDTGNDKLGTGSDSASGPIFGQESVPVPNLKTEADRLIKYFFACLTIPEKDLWVNLSPYEKDRMVPDALGKTALGRDLLAQDYILKQLTASLIYPEKDLGKEFWDKVYTKARQMYGQNVEIPVNTFNKVWIMADKASVYEHNQTAFIASGHLKVMLEEDYLALEKNASVKNLSSPNALVGDPNTTTHSLSSQIIKEIILPEIEHEINTGKNFAMLRQIFYSQILAVWFKNNLKESLLAQVYGNKSTVKGIDSNDAKTNEEIYQQYLQAYKKGVFNYIKEDQNPITKEILPRKYFSGGYTSLGLKVSLAATVNPTPTGSFAMVTAAVTSGTDLAMATQKKKPVKIIADPTKMEFNLGDQKEIKFKSGKRVSIRFTKSPANAKTTKPYKIRINDFSLEYEKEPTLFLHRNCLIVFSERIPGGQKSLDFYYIFSSEKPHPQDVRSIGRILYSINPQAFFRVLAYFQAFESRDRHSVSFYGTSAKQHNALIGVTNARAVGTNLNVVFSNNKILDINVDELIEGLWHQRGALDFAMLTDKDVFAYVKFVRNNGLPERLVDLEFLREVYAHDEKFKNKKILPVLMKIAEAMAMDVFRRDIDVRELFDAGRDLGVLLQWETLIAEKGLQKFIPYSEIPQEQDSLFKAIQDGIVQNKDWEIITARFGQLMMQKLVQRYGDEESKLKQVIKNLTRNTQHVDHGITKAFDDVMGSVAEDEVFIKIFEKEDAIDRLIALDHVSSETSQYLFSVLINEELSDINKLYEVFERARAIKAWALVRVISQVLEEQKEDLKPWFKKDDGYLNEIRAALDLGYFNDVQDDDDEAQEILKKLKVPVDPAMASPAKTAMPISIKKEGVLGELGFSENEGKEIYFGEFGPYNPSEVEEVLKELYRNIGGYNDRDFDSPLRGTHLKLYEQEVGKKMTKEEQNRANIRSLILKNMLGALRKQGYNIRLVHKIREG